MIGTTLRNRFKILQELGHGGFSQTYLAEDGHHHKRPVCVVKRFKPQTTSPQALAKAYELFEREADILDKLGVHDQIPRLIAYFEEPLGATQEFFLIQEFVEGHDLTHEIREGEPLPETQVVLLLKDLLTIVEFVHHHQTIHRDIKPSNVIRRKRDQKLVLIDFGAVKEIKTCFSGATTIGTRGYMPHEQFTGNPQLCSDIHAIGMVAIQALTGTSPVNFAKNPITNEWLWGDRTCFNPELVTILNQMVRWDFRERYQTVAEVLSALEPLIARQIVPPSPSPANPSSSTNSAVSVITLPPQIPTGMVAAPSSTSSARISQGVTGAIALLSPILSLRQQLGERFKMPYAVGLIAIGLIAGAWAYQRLIIEPACPLPSVPSGLFTYGGSTTWVPIRANVDSVIQRRCPQFRLRYLQPIAADPGSGPGIHLLIKDQLDFAQSSRPLTSKEYQEARLRGFDLEAIPVAIDGVAAAVHPNLSIPGLTIAQLKDIYSGQITNWKQIGGPNLPIIAYSRRPDVGGGINMFVEDVLPNQVLSSRVKLMSTVPQALQQVAQTPGAIYFPASASEIVRQCTVKPLPLGLSTQTLVAPYQGALIPAPDCFNKHNLPNLKAFQQGDYPLTRQLFVIVKADKQAAEKAGRAYADLLLTPTGQDLLEKAGFVRVR
jgi:phosphate transport system substrate-binding protein